jgi:hypothetical protein
MEVSEGWDNTEDVSGLRKALGGCSRLASCTYSFEMKDPLGRRAVEHLAPYWIASPKATS